MSSGEAIHIGVADDVISDRSGRTRADTNKRVSKTRLSLKLISHPENNTKVNSQSNSWDTHHPHHRRNITIAMMPKLPVSASPHSKPSTASSAWTRLVQNTKTASKTSRHSDAKSPGARTQSSPTSTASMARLSRPVKRRRVTSPRKPPSAPTSTSSLFSLAAVSGHDADHTETLSRESASDSASTTQTRRCPEGEQPLSKRRCSSSPPRKRKSASIKVSTSSPTRADLRTIWASGLVEKQSFQDELSLKSDGLGTGEAGEEGTAAKRSENGKVPVSGEDEGSEQDVENQLLRQVTGRHVGDNERPGMVQRNNADITDTTAMMPTPVESTENPRATSDKSARLGSVSSSSHGGFRKRRRSKLEHDIAKIENGLEQQAMTTGNESDTAMDRQAENTPAPPPTATTPGLQEDTIKSSLNRAPEFATTSTTSQSSISTDEKENASAPARKAKRRLTLHDTHPQQQKKKRKVVPRQTVQTTLALAIGGNAGMRECKVCDTVYNPFHPEDVKVHAKRHAGVVRKERRTVEL